MRRAIILIITLSVLCFGSGHYLDCLRQNTALSYLQEVESLRQLVLDQRWQEAAAQERLLTARWQHDASWLKCLISHQHIRDIDAALLRLSTSLTHQWPDEALPALDEAYLALNELQSSHLPNLSNVI